MRFVDPEGEPEVLVVVDMLLTGFDAPVEQVLYLDKSLQRPRATPGHRPRQPALRLTTRMTVLPLKRLTA